MKTTGIALIIIGLLLTITTGFKYFTREKVVDIGSLKVSTSVPHRVNWPPFLGIGMMVAGGLVVVLGKKTFK